ncbi:MAG TPA: type II toxin-antitoxin system RelE/ParE family toxin [Terracidiphilus sp.]|nr:type II toxin-antitoxin system RelE/ParE family toxin [Terracidiphilus sp.]
MIELKISEAASLSIVEQAEYYEQAAEHTLALRWEKAIGEAIHGLLKMPESGAPCRLSSPALANLRWTPVAGFPKHMIFYRYSAQEQILLIIQVLHGARDLEAILSEGE